MMLWDCTSVMVALSVSLTVSLITPSLSICFEQGVAPRRMATGEPQYCFICPGQCDKVVFFVRSRFSITSACLSLFWLWLAKQKKDAMFDRPVHTVPVHTTDTISLNV